MAIKEKIKKEKNIIKGKALKLEGEVEGEVKKHPFVFFWDPVILYFLGIIIISNLPVAPTIETAILGYPIWDKIKHLILYFGFSFLLGVACRHSNFTLLRRNHYFIAITAASIVGIIDELNQGRIPGRNMELGDVYADMIGSVLAQGTRFILRLERRLLRRIF